MEIPQSFTVELDAGARALADRNQRETNKFQTRYVYAPLRDLACPQIPRQFVPPGVIHPIPSPKGKCGVRMLPDGAEVLRVVSPSQGVPIDGAAALSEIEQLKQQVAELKNGQEPPSVAIYQLEVAPIVAGLLSTYGNMGVIEIVTLRGMSDATFEKYRMNDLLFGPEGERPTTAKGVVERMQAVITQAKGQKGEGARILASVASETLKSVEQCARYCAEHVRERHLQMEDPQNDAPKRYSQGDLRAIEFIGATKRNEYLQKAAEQQEQAMAAFPQMANAFNKMADVMAAQTEALKTLSNPKKQS